MVTLRRHLNARHGTGTRNGDPLSLRSISTTPAPALRAVGRLDPGESLTALAIQMTNPVIAYYCAVALHPLKRL